MSVYDKSIINLYCNYRSKLQFVFQFFPLTLFLCDQFNVVLLEFLVEIFLKQRTK
jgi:hypothetical protein